MTTNGANFSSVKPIVILEHNPEVPPGYLGDAIARSGLPGSVVRLYEGEPLPDLDGVGAVVSLGGIMGAYEEEEHPFLVAEKEYLREAVERSIPVLGICLGCQLLADALGGRAYRADTLEVEFAGLELAGDAPDAVLDTLAEPVVSFHQDTWDPPEGVDVLASSGRYNHAFRTGSALAIQSHPEASAELVAEWVETFGRDKLVANGVDPDQLLEAVRDGNAANEARASRLFDAWLAEVVAQAR